MRDQVIQKYLLIFSALYAEQDLLLMERESSTWKRHPMAVYMVVNLQVRGKKLDAKRHC